MNNCHCGSGKTYAECCETIINSESAPTALSLMRSRYTAYKTGQAAYLRNTSHAKTRGQYNLSDLEDWSKENQWIKLEIISQEHGNINDTRGIVEFKAYYKNKSKTIEILHERSNFLKENGKWYYLDGIQNPQKTDLTKKVLRNDPCPCGSGKKQKKCCGKTI